MPSDLLVQQLRKLVDRGNALTAELLVHLGEVDDRRLFLQAACPSMFRYCTDILGMSEGQSYKQIGAARLARKFSGVLPMVHSGQVHLCALAMLACHMTEDNSQELLQMAVHRSKRKLEKLIAKRFPAPPVPDRVRKSPRRRNEVVTDVTSVAPLLLDVPAVQQASAVDVSNARGVQRPDPETADVDTARTPAPRRGVGQATVSPLSAETYKIQLTASQPLYEKLRQAQELLGHQVPNGDLATVFERALDALLPRLRKQRFAELSKPRKTSPMRAEPETREQDKSEARQDRRGGEDKVGRKDAAHDEAAPVGVAEGVPAKGPTRRSRHIPAGVKRQVAERDGYQCTYTDKTGRRCPERGLVEFHHVRPYGQNGGHEVSNVRLLCKAHNAQAAEHDYGEQAMKRWRRGADDRVPLRTVPGDCGSRAVVMSGAAPGTKGDGMS